MVTSGWYSQDLSDEILLRAQELESVRLAVGYKYILLCGVQLDLKIQLEGGVFKQGLDQS